MPATIALAHAGRHHRRMGRCPARGVRRVPGPHRRRRRGRATGAPSSAAVRGAVQGPGRPHRWPAPAAGGQAGSRRPLQRGRADRRGRPRRRLRGGLPGDPARPRPRSPPPPATRTSTWWASPSSPAATSSWSPRWSTGCGPPGSTPRWWSGGIIPPEDADDPGGQGGGPGLHAQGLRDRPDDGRHAEPGRGAPRRAGRLTTGAAGSASGSSGPARPVDLHPRRVAPGRFPTCPPVATQWPASSPARSTPRPTTDWLKCSPKVAGGRRHGAESTGPADSAGCWCGSRAEASRSADGPGWNGSSAWPPARSPSTVAPLAEPGPRLPSGGRPAPRR